MSFSAAGANPVVAVETLIAAIRAVSNEVDFGEPDFEQFGYVSNDE